MLSAAAAALGVIPLLQDVFWVGLAVTMIGGLAVGTVLIMILVPVLYAILYQADRPEVSHDLPASQARST